MYMCACVPAGSSELRVRSCEGWRAGDQIAIAPTGAHDDSEAFTVTEVSGASKWCIVMLDGLLRKKHLGSESQTAGFGVFAEVIHMTRSVRITGPAFPRFDPRPEVRGGAGHQGIVTMQMDGGSMQLHYTRVDNCGRVALGHYCTHFHHLDDCPDCKLVGNAILDGANKGVTVHATHRRSWRQR